MTKNLKTLICCILTLALVGATVVFVFAGNDSVAVTEAETGTEVESVVEVESEPESEASSIVIGDVNGDGEITAKDARLALRISAKLDVPTADQKVAADVNGDGDVTAKDARSILRYSAKLDTAFAA